MASGDPDCYYRMTGLPFGLVVERMQNFLVRSMGKINVEIVSPACATSHPEKLKALFGADRVRVDCAAVSRAGTLENVGQEYKGKTRFNELGDQCFQTKTNLSILYDGSVLVCSNDWTRKSVSVFPNVADVDPFQIFRGKEFSRLTRCFESGDYSSFPMCEICARENGFRVTK